MSEESSESSVAPTDERASPSTLVRSVEWIGKHPFATGLMAVLGIAGFLLSVAGFQLDRSEADATTDQIAEAQADLDSIGGDLSEVREAVTANCSSPPCWTIRDFARWETIGRPKDLIDAKLPPSERRRDGATYYNLDGCRLRVEFTDDAVSYFSASLRGIRETVDTEGRTQYDSFACDVDLDEIVRNVDYDWPAQDRLRMGQVIEAMTSPEFMRGNLPEIYIASACIDCGNYREPYLEVLRPGPHAADFVNTHFTTMFYGVDDDTGEQGDAMLHLFRETMRERIGPAAEYNVDVQQLCGVDVSGNIAYLLPAARVTEVGLGKGPRTWTDNLYCRWWE